MKMWIVRQKHKEHAIKIIDWFNVCILNVTDVSVMNDDTLMISTKIKKIIFHT